MKRDKECFGYRCHKCTAGGGGEGSALGPPVTREPSVPPSQRPAAAPEPPSLRRPPVPREAPSERPAAAPEPPTLFDIR